MITKYLPTLAGMVVEDQTRPVLAKLPDEPQPVLRPPSQLFMIFIKESEVAAMTALYYTLQVKYSCVMFNPCFKLILMFHAFLAHLCSR